MGCQKMKRRFAVLLILLFLIICVQPVSAQSNDSLLVAEIKDILWKHYYEPLPYNFLKQNSLEEVFSFINDPYTRYYSDEEFDDFLLSLEGKYGGIGLEIDLKDGQIIVTKIIPNTPASRVNIQQGDIITHVDNQPLANMDLEKIKDLFSGKAGTYIKIRTYRPRTDTYLSYLLTREDIYIKPVEASILSRNIGYIKILEFNQEAASDFSRQLKILRDQGIKGLILDLRDNPGGLIGTALDVSRELLPPGLFVKLYYRGEKPELITTVGNTGNPLPLIVLVNKDTASAAEILAGAIQDRNAGIIIGTKTYGKATVQSMVPLVKGGALKFTSGKYLTPNGRQINGMGLNPDFYVPNSHSQIIEAIWMLNNKVHNSLTYQLNHNYYLINGQVKPCPVKPFLYSGNFMVPLRNTVESLGGKIKYSNPDDIQISIGQDIIKLRLNQRYFTFNGQRHYLPVAPMLKNQQTMIPVRAIAQLLGAKVEWRPSTGQVVISR